MPDHEMPRVAMSMGMLDALASQWERIDLATSCSETTDNSLDARATLIEYEIDVERFVVRDNGDGIRDVAKFSVFGESQRRNELDRVTSGRYGAGGKCALLGLGRMLRIRTCHGGKTKHGLIDFQRAIDHGVAEFAEYRVTDTPDASPYTELEVTALQNINRFSKLSKLRSTLALRYYPALRDGKRILINGEPLPNVELPRLEHRKTFTRVFDGRQVVVDIGVLRHEDRDRFAPGVYFEAASRLLGSRPDVSGFGNYPNAQVLAWVRLIEDKAKGQQWRLTLDKSDFGEREALLDFLFPDIEDVLRIGAEAADHLDISQRDLQTQKLLSSVFDGNAREKRDRKAVQLHLVQSEKSAPTGRRRRNASKVTSEPGSVDRGAASPIMYTKANVEKLPSGGVIEISHTKTRINVKIAALHPAFAPLKPKDFAFAVLHAAIPEMGHYLALHDWPCAHLLNLQGIDSGLGEKDRAAYIAGQLYDRIGSLWRKTVPSPEQTNASASGRPTNEAV